MKKIKWGTLVFLIIYLAILAYVCFWSEDYGRMDVQNIYRYNLVPFREIIRFYTYRDVVGFDAFLLNLFGNVLVFIPFGVMVPIVSSRNRKFFRVFGLTFLLSLFIECIQLISKVGSFDVDDLILNTVGGILGYILFWIMNQIRRHWFVK
ncbi:MAG: VanZ family protein [Clostridia bacterium]|nr:VanZ family protein [Lachnospiraceae bacterium]NCC01481.1 VanZ family protein [Clostridia bacterium]NCD03276.1 VanZ family protein [Clostridia bacterium]